MTWHQNIAGTTRAWTVVGYVYRADVWCPNCIVPAVCERVLIRTAASLAFSTEGNCGEEIR